MTLPQFFTIASSHACLRPARAFAIASGTRAFLFAVECFFNLFWKLAKILFFHRRWKNKKRAAAAAGPRPILTMLLPECFHIVRRDEGMERWTTERGLHASSPKCNRNYYLDILRYIFKYLLYEITGHMHQKETVFSVNILILTSTKNLYSQSRHLKNYISIYINKHILIHISVKIKKN